MDEKIVSMGVKVHKMYVCVTNIRMDFYKVVPGKKVTG